MKPDPTHQPPDTDWITYLTGDARSISTLISPGSVDAIVTSPPYNVGIPNYPSGVNDLIPWADYATFAHVVARELYAIAKPTARIWLNVQPTVPIEPGNPAAGRFYLLGCWANALADAGWIYRDTVAWVQDSFDGGCAWGSWGSPSAPNLRGSWEAIILAFKDEWKRPVPASMDSRKVGGNDGQWKPRWIDPRADKKIVGEDGVDWPELTRNVWKVPPAHGGYHYGTAVGEAFPAAFPLEIAERCIRLSTWPGQTVLDPFAGSGTVGHAAEHVQGGPRYAICVDLGWPDPTDPRQSPPTISRAEREADLAERRATTRDTFDEVRTRQAERIRKARIAAKLQQARRRAEQAHQRAGTLRVKMEPSPETQDGAS